MKLCYYSRLCRFRCPVFSATYKKTSFLSGSLFLNACPDATSFLSVWFPSKRHSTVATTERENDLSGKSHVFSDSMSITLVKEWIMENLVIPVMQHPLTTNLISCPNLRSNTPCDSRNRTCYLLRHMTTKHKPTYPNYSDENS